MARMKKEYRELTVSEACCYGRNPAPQLRIQGLWLKDLGFNIGDSVQVKCEDGKLIISRDKEKERREAEQKLYYDSQMAAFQAQLVAECKEKFGAGCQA